MKETQQLLMGKSLSSEITNTYQKEQLEYIQVQINKIKIFGRKETITNSMTDRRWSERKEEKPPEQN